MTFSEDMANVGPSDFSVTGAAGGTATTATVQSATAVPGGTTAWDVTVSGGDLGTYHGTVGLAFDPSQDIADAAGNALADTTPSGADETYTADALPAVASIARQTPGAAATNADSLTFRVTFSEDVQNVGPADFSVTGAAGGTATTATVQSATAVSGGASAWDVTVSSGNLADYEGTVGLAFATDQDIADTTGNALTATTPTSGTNETFTLDNTAPAATLAAPDMHDGSSPFDVTVTFSEDVEGFDAAADLAITGGALTSGADSITRTDARTYTANITPSGRGGVTVQAPAGAARDAAGNDSTASNTATVHAPPGITVSTTTLSVREGGSGTYTVVLDSPPTENVSVTAWLHNGAGTVCDCDVDISLMEGIAQDGRHPERINFRSLTFTPTDWDTPQTVTVLAAEDDDDVHGTDDIQHNASSQDGRYNLRGPDVTVTEVDTRRLTSRPRPCLDHPPDASRCRHQRRQPHLPGDLQRGRQERGHGGLQRHRARRRHRHHRHGAGRRGGPGRHVRVRHHRERRQPGRLRRHRGPRLRHRPGHRRHVGQPARRHRPHQRHQRELDGGQHRADGGVHRASHAVR